MSKTKRLLISIAIKSQKTSIPLRLNNRVPVFFCIFLFLYVQTYFNRKFLAFFRLSNIKYPTRSRSLQATRTLIPIPYICIYAKSLIYIQKKKWIFLFIKKKMTTMHPLVSKNSKSQQGDATNSGGALTNLFLIFFLIIYFVSFKFCIFFLKLILKIL